MTRRTDDIRLRYLYRDLVLRGKARLSRSAAIGLIGPDRAFHLYQLVHPAGVPLRPSARGRGRRQRRTSS